MPETLIRAFESGHEPLVFQGAQREMIAADLRVRVETPKLISQETASLCGPAAFMYCVASAYPRQYVSYVIELATKGEASLGKMKVKPSQACRHPRISAIGYTDWIALASLRDSTNSFFNMNGEDASMAGITTGGNLSAWFESSGLFNQVTDQAHYLSAGSLQGLLAAERSSRLGNYVCLLVRAAILGKVGGELHMSKIGRNTPKTILGTPDHWIVVQGPMNLGPYCYNSACPDHTEALLDKELDFQVYSWGALGKINGRINKLTTRSFLPYFYGFVAAHRA
ncbi:hypothetical protein [Pseudomonas sp. RIT-PI-AD]|uniref:hypothetical protein n=1 Tax=Pseudomonas sp. RIT-PI-AD TaxID=3035294 RepID=UPI0021DB11FF|nr:hypothetical protein [Pseudomonas sp. RIT-PI-AD]